MNGRRSYAPERGSGEAERAAEYQQATNWGQIGRGRVREKTNARGAYTEQIDSASVSFFVPNEKRGEEEDQNGVAGLSPLRAN